MCSSTCCPQWTILDAELDAGMELDATVRRSDLDCAQRESRREAMVRPSAVRGAGDARRGKSSARHEAQGAGGVREARDAGAGGSILSVRTDVG
jgi:hypothetical protein